MPPFHVEDLECSGTQSSSASSVDFAFKSQTPPTEHPVHHQTVSNTNQQMFQVPNSPDLFEEEEREEQINEYQNTLNGFERNFDNKNHQHNLSDLKFSTFASQTQHHFSQSDDEKSQLSQENITEDVMMEDQFSPEHNRQEHQHLINPNDLKPQEKYLNQEPEGGEGSLSDSPLSLHLNSQSQGDIKVYSDNDDNDDHDAYEQMHVNEGNSHHSAYEKIINKGNDSQMVTEKKGNESPKEDKSMKPKRASIKFSIPVRDEQDISKEDDLITPVPQIKSSEQQSHKTPVRSRRKHYNKKIVKPIVKKSEKECHTTVTTTTTTVTTSTLKKKKKKRSLSSEFRETIQRAKQQVANPSPIKNTDQKNSNKFKHTKDSVINNKNNTNGASGGNEDETYATDAESKSEGEEEYKFPDDDKKSDIDDAISSEGDSDDDSECEETFHDRHNHGSKKLFQKSQTNQKVKGSKDHMSKSRKSAALSHAVQKTFLSIHQKKKVFKDILFIVTGPVKDGNLPSMIQELGGTCIDERNEMISDADSDFSTIRDKKIVLIADKPYRTFKYLLALALNIPLLKAYWVEVCHSEEQLLFPCDENYYLSPGTCFSSSSDGNIVVAEEAPDVKEDMYPQSAEEGLYAKCTILLLGAKHFIESWEKIFKAAGALMVSNEKEILQWSGGRIPIIYYADKAPLPLVKKATANLVRVELIEHAIQSLIGDEILPPSEKWTANFASLQRKHEEMMKKGTNQTVDSSVISSEGDSNFDTNDFYPTEEAEPKAKAKSEVKPEPKAELRIGQKSHSGNLTKTTKYMMMKKLKKKKQDFQQLDHGSNVISAKKGHMLQQSEKAIIWGTCIGINKKMGRNYYMECHIQENHDDFTSLQRFAVGTFIRFKRNGESKIASIVSIFSEGESSYFTLSLLKLDGIYCTFAGSISEFNLDQISHVEPVIMTSKQQLSQLQQQVPSPAIHHCFVLSH